jgi:Ca2+-binding EF-hand superfamily protein
MVRMGGQSARAGMARGGMDIQAELSADAPEGETAGARAQRKNKAAEQDASANIKWQSGPFAICTKIAGNESFQNFILLVICLNAVWIGVDMEMKADNQQYIWFDSFEVFGLVENLFCVAFTFEVFVRFFQYKIPIYHYFTDPQMYHWNWFDCMLVGMMIFEQWIVVSPLAPFDVEKIKAQGEGEDGGLSSLSSLRLLRLLRISRMVRIVRMFPELAIMLKSMAAATRGVLSTMFLAMILIYVFSVIFTQWGKDNADGEMRTRYGSFGVTWMSLAQFTIGNDAYTLVRYTYSVSYTYGILCHVFIVMSSFTVLNMLIGVIVEIVQETQKREKDTILMGKIVEVFSEIDADGSGQLSPEEMKAGVEKLVAIGVERKHIMAAMDFVDGGLDDGETDLDEFVELMRKLNGPVEATDLIEVAAQVKAVCDHASVECMGYVRPMDLEEEAFVDDPDKARLLGMLDIAPQKSVASSRLSSIASSQSGLSSVASTESGDSAPVQGDDIIGIMPAMTDVDKASQTSVFKKPDADSMGLGDPDLQYTTGFCQYFCNSEKFGAFILGVICLNGLWISVEIECNDTDEWHCSEGGAAPVILGLDPFQLVENIFCVIFTFEIIVRIGAYLKLKFFFLDKSMRVWNIFDTILVALMIFENWVVLLLDMDSSGLSMFSIFRLLRLLRISRIIRSSPELSIMVKSLIAAFRSVGTTMALLVGFIYVFAIIMTQWATKNAENDPYIEGEQWHTSGNEPRTGIFGTIFLSMLTGAQLIVCDDGMSIARHVMNRSKSYGVFLMIFQYGGAFTLLNMLIGVICEIVSVTKAGEIERMRVEKCKKVFKDLDEDKSGSISMEEFMAKKHLVIPLGIDEETCSKAFELCDKDKSGDLSPTEFMTLCFKLTQEPETIDIKTMQYNLKKLAMSLKVNVDTEQPKSAGKAVRMGNIRRCRTELTMAAGYGQAEVGGPGTIWTPEPEEEDGLSARGSKGSKRSKGSKKSKK